MPTTRGSSSSGVSAVAISGSEQQEDPVMDVDPPKNDPIDVDEDKEPSLMMLKTRCVTFAFCYGGRVIGAVLVAVQTPSSVLYGSLQQ